MAELHAEYGHRGLAILALPSDEFGGQELDTDEDILAFAHAQAPDTFPPHTIVTKGAVNGPHARPTYR
jgi:glutathione peroxidase|eukprot:COSAG01_NODE_3470_length_6049_cov_689.357815_9_plen_68_part_00